MNREEAKTQLLEEYQDYDHPEGCVEVDYFFTSKEYEGYQYDNVISIKCWNCSVKDHYLVSND